MDPHVDLLTQIEAQYMLKNLAYNNAASMTYRKFGTVAYILRLTDKMSRYENLLEHADINNGDESIDDTLRDAINYLFMLVGDLITQCKEPSDSRNIKETLSQIRYIAKMEYYEVQLDADRFEERWLSQNGKLSDVPYRLFVEDDGTVFNYLDFAEYLIVLYIERRENQ